jgi:hypothetical protein
MNPLQGAEPEDLGARQPVSMWKLDRLIAGELPEAEAAELRKTVASSPELQSYLLETGKLKSNLSVQAMLKAVRGEDAPAPSFPSRFREFLQSRGSRQGGVAIAFAAALGIGMWSWQAREAAPVGSGYQTKGKDAPDIRIVLNGAEYDTSDLVQSRSGDTLGFSYRSPFPITMQIWYREDDKPAEAMPGPSSISVWKTSMGWRRASERVILEGRWKRQSIFVIWSQSGFTDGEARRLLGKGEAMDPGSGMHTASFRLAWPD